MDLFAFRLSKEKKYCIENIMSTINNTHENKNHILISNDNEQVSDLSTTSASTSQSHSPISESKRMKGMRMKVKEKLDSSNESSLRMKKQKEILMCTKCVNNSRLRSQNPNWTGIFDLHLSKNKQNQLKERLVKYFRQYMHDKKMKKDSVIRKHIIEDMWCKVKNKFSKDLIAYGDNPEFYKGISKSQKKHVEVQACHVLKAFEILDRYYELKRDIT